MVKAFKTLAILLITLLLGGVVTMTLLSSPLERDAPRNLPWTLPDYRIANTQWRIDDNGRIESKVEHLFLKDITPAMVAWFYQQLPISTVNLNGTTYPLYHIFHPTEHGRIRVLHPAPSGKPGMTQGATIMREEWFGPFDSKGAALMTEFSDDGMLAIPKFLGIVIGRVHHQYTSTPEGTHYIVDATIGSDLPVIGPIINWIIRTYVFHPQLMSQWQRHQIEEVSSLQFFLPELYKQHNPNNHYTLNKTSSE